jgi:hypothetical protein
VVTSGPQVSIKLSVGNHLILLAVTDDEGAIAFHSVTVTVESI